MSVIERLCNISIILPNSWNGTDPRGRGHSHTWRWRGTSALLTLIFDIFRSHWVPFLCLTRFYWPPLSAEKIGLSLSHSVSEIIWPKVGIYFTEICHLTLLKQVVPIFSLIFDLVTCRPLFPLLLDIFVPSFLQNLRSRWVHFIIAWW